MKAAVRASNHQGSPEFSGSGRQCTCNVLINFVHYCSFGSPQTWLQQDLDQILDLGDTLYEAIANNEYQKYLLIDELPEDVWKWKVIYSELITGPLLSSSLSTLDISRHLAP